MSVFPNAETFVTLINKDDNFEMVIYLLIFVGLKDLRFCTRILDEINYSCDGSSVVQTEAGEAYGLDKVALTHVESVTVEHENQVQVSINKVMSYLKQVCFGA